MVLHDDRTPRHPRRFTKQHVRIFGVVEDIDEHYGVLAPVVERDTSAVEK
jgi:hypothetical protein